MATDADEAIKKRIITHMNHDHKDSLARYLEFYCLLPAAVTQSAELEDITLEYMIIVSTKSRNYIPFEPALTSWAEVRERLTKLDDAALAGLGRSRTVITEYKPPRGFHAVVFIATVLTFAAFYRQANFWPGSVLYDGLLHNFESFTKFCRAIQPILFPVMLFIHLSETVWFDWSRLSRYNVPRFGGLWWLWMGSNALEGVGAHQRFDALVRSLENGKSKDKH